MRSPPSCATSASNSRGRRRRRSAGRGREPDRPRAAGREPPNEGGAEWVSFFAHVDTVPHSEPITVVEDDGVFRTAGDTILGADNKAAVTVVMELGRAAGRRARADRARDGLHRRRGAGSSRSGRSRRRHAALEARLRPRSRDADRGDHHGGSDLQEGDRGVPGGRVPRRDPARGRSQRDRRRQRRQSRRWISVASIRRRPPTSA